MAVDLKSYQFRRDRESSWLELEALIERVEKKSIRALSAVELERLPILYRQALSSLSVARSISLDENLVEYLEGLAGRAYFCVYGTRSPVWRPAAAFLLRTFPRAVRAAKWQVIVAALIMGLGVATAYTLTIREPDLFYAFVDEAYSQGRNPTATTAALREVLYDEGTMTDSLATFATFLFTHNAQVGILAFSVGFLLGIPVFLLMFMNGLILGAFAALYASRGLSVDLWGWLLPHGVTELLAVVLCGGAGLILAQSLVLPGRRSRLRNLALRGREAAVVVIGAVMMLFIAALIEGFFRQLVTDISARYIVAAVSAALWTLYFGFAGKGGTDGDAESA
jgi:uncharacterized membrane protein SpoIIM required for sporulation